MPQLSAGDVHVHSVSLDRPPEQLHALAQLLSPDEHARADRFRFERDRARYVAGRGILRVALGAYLGRAPASLRFAYGEFEKPHLSDGDLHFNLSHSGATALIAVTRVAEVGVDVELEPVSFDYEALATRFFSPAEVRALHRVAAPQRPRAFLSCWTRKEAFIKARGDGLQLALDSFDVSLDPAHPAVLQRTAWSEDEPGQWTIRDVSDPRQDYVGAVAIRSRDAHVVRDRLAGELDGWLTTQEDR